MANKWYNVSIRGQQINWATLTASAVLFVGLEIWRRILQQILDRI